MFGSLKKYAAEPQFINEVLHCQHQWRNHYTHGYAFAMYRYVASRHTSVC